MEPLVGENLDTLIQSKLGMTVPEMAVDLKKSLGIGYSWRKFGVSKKACIEIEIKYSRKIKPYELRPDIFVAPDYKPSPETIEAAQKKFKQLAAMEL